MRKIALYCFMIFTMGFTACTKDNSVSTTNNGGGISGQGGSLAKFTILNDYLYTVDNQSLSVFDISNAGAPTFVNKVSIGFGIEAIFPFENKLFIASNSAMYIYSVTNPSQPAFVSLVEHFTGCDPIVANDSIAFLTIHGGNTCGSQLNELMIYDIKNLAFPKAISNMTMNNPFGLGLKDTVLYVCDNGQGLKVINIKDPYHPKQIGLVGGENFVDVIPSNNLLISYLTDGIGYFDITNPANPQKLATIKN